MFVFVLCCHCLLLFYRVFFVVWGCVFPFLFSSCNKGALRNIKVVLVYTVYFKYLFVLCIGLKVV